MTQRPFACSLRSALRRDRAGPRARSARPPSRCARRRSWRRLLPRPLRPVVAGHLLSAGIRRVLLKGVSLRRRPRRLRPRRGPLNKTPARHHHVRLPIRAQGQGGLRRRLRRGSGRRSRAARRRTHRLDFRGALARRRRHRQEPQRHGNHLHVRPAPPDRRVARGRRPGPLGVHAVARRERG